jgi:hypothetical protein
MLYLSLIILQHVSPLGPIHIQLLSYWILSILDHCEVPICLEIIPKHVIVKLGGPLMGVFMSINHWLILSPCEICRPARVTTIHSSKGVLIISSKWTLNLLNYVTSSWFSCLTNSLTLSHICSFLITLGGTCITSPSGFSSCPPWTRSNHKIISLAWAVIVGEVITRCLTACSSLDRHLHTIAYESLEKLLSARDEKDFVPKRRTRAKTTSRTLSGQTELCPGGGLGQICEKRTTSD